MKTPEEIKQGLECCAGAAKCKDCPYFNDNDAACGGNKNRDALAYIHQLEDQFRKVAKMAPQWVSVDERMPEAGTLCIVFGHKRGVKHMDLALCGTTGTWEFGMASSFEITHWMPLPEQPKEEDK